MGWFGRHKKETKIKGLEKLSPDEQEQLLKALQGSPDARMMLAITCNNCGKKTESRSGLQALPPTCPHCGKHFLA